MNDTIEQQESESERAWFRSLDEWNSQGIMPCTYTSFGKGFEAGLEYARRWNVIETDGLPKVDGSYLCSCVHRLIKIAPTVWELSFSNNYWTDGHEYFDINEDWEIVAWQELPQAHIPEPGKESE